MHFTEIDNDALTYYILLYIGDIVFLLRFRVHSADIIKHTFCMCKLMHLVGLKIFI